jgi:hypothetical protein
MQPLFNGLFCIEKKRKGKTKRKEEEERFDLYKKKKTMRKEQEKAAREVKSIYC